jgi:hypothetical protein
MKRFLAVVIAVLVVTSLVSAQSAQNVWGQGKMSAGVGLEVAFPTGNYGDIVSTGFGGFGLFQYGINEDIVLTGQIGYTGFGNKVVGSANGNNITQSANSLAILVGGKYNLTKTTPGLYGMLQLGIYSTSSTASTPYLGTTISASASESDFVLAPGIGYQVGPIDASLKYVINSNVGNLALNIAYIFQL